MDIFGFIRVIRDLLHNLGLFNFFFSNENKQQTWIFKIHKHWVLNIIQTQNSHLFVLFELFVGKKER